MKSVREDAVRWFARLRDAGPDHPDRGRFETWLASDPAHAAEYRAIADIWGDFDSPSRLDSLAGALEQRNAAQTRNKDGRRKLLKRGLLGLVVCTGTGAVAWRGWQYWAGLPVAQLVAQTRTGESGRQALPDGSSVILGADARIELLYYRERRTVTLVNGDAIFDVTRDPDRPFVVDSGLARATVLGTRFAINRSQQMVRVSVASGRVRVEDFNGGLPILLDADQVAEIEAGGVLRRIPAAARDGFAWQQGTLIFDNATLGEIAARLSRYRRLPVKAIGEAGHRVTAVVQIADVEHFIHGLPSIAPVRIEELPGETRILSP